MKNQKFLEEKFVEFLHTDTELATDLEKILEDYDSQDHRLEKRAVTTMSPESFEEIPGQKPPGFFDKAAKFLVELLQKFLRWINTDSS